MRLRLVHTFEFVAALLWPPYPWRGFRVWFWRDYYLIRDWREWIAGTPSEDTE